MNGGATLFLTTLTRVSVADDFLALLDRADAADVEAHRRVELQRVAAGRRFRDLPNITPIFMRIWLMKMTIVLERLMFAGQLAQRLAHQARLQADVRIAHLAFDFGLRRQRGDRVDDDDVDRARAHQHVGDFERLFAGIRLRDQQVVDVDAELLRVDRIERVLGVDERAGAAVLLALAMTCSVSVVLPDDSGP